MNFPTKLYADSENKVVVSVSTVLKKKHFMIPMETWDMSSWAVGHRKVRGHPKILWEYFDENFGRNLASSVVREGPFATYKSRTIQNNFYLVQYDIILSG